MRGAQATKQSSSFFRWLPAWFQATSSVEHVLDLLAEFLLDHIVVVHGFIKKTQKTPDEELTLARKRKRIQGLKEARMIKSKKKKAPRSPNRLSTLDDLLKQEGKLEEFRATAIKEVLAWQIEEAMKANNISRAPKP